jgi:hypothetical protein
VSSLDGAPETAMPAGSGAVVVSVVIEDAEGAQLPLWL